MASSRESCRQPSREEGKAPSNYSAAKASHCCCLCFPAAMQKYIELANQKRKPKKTNRSNKEDPLGGQMLISIGRMVYDSRLQRGVQDRSFTVAHQGGIPQG